VAWGIDHVQRIAGTIEFPGHAHSLGLDGDAALAFDVHTVQILGLHVAGLNDAGVLQHAVGQSGFTVVDVGDDAEVPDDGRICRGGHRCGAGHGRHAGSLLLASVGDTDACREHGGCNLSGRLPLL
jgi:hypothetical protein